MRITEEQLIKEYGVSKDDLNKIYCYAHGILVCTEYAIFEWDRFFSGLKEILCVNGGDEDWVVFAAEEPEYLPRWLTSIDTLQDPDVYIFEDFVVYVGSH